ncbi:MAG: hypothetical protein M0R03_00385 [Novosphingobium sp.]|nr:hypothetical protein [Novosphingobium sp.]
MTHVSTTPGARRRRLLLGSAMAALAVSLPVSALAFPPIPPDLDATGIVIAVSDQQQSETDVTATANYPIMEVWAQPDDSDIALADNLISSAARANRSSSSMAPDSEDLDGATGGTSISTGASGVEAWAPALIATRQSTHAAPVTARTANSRIAVHLDDPVQSNAEFAGNVQEAVALANDASGSLALSGISASAGAGIVTDQSIDTSSRVTAKMVGKALIETSDSTDSDLSLSDNLQRAIGYGNSGVSNLSVETAAIESVSGSFFGSSVQSGAQNPSVYAAYAIVSDQRDGGDVEARAVGGYAVDVANTAVGSSISNSTNSLIAAGYGNQSANNLTLSTNTANTIAGGLWNRALGNITNVQKTEDGEITALSNGGVRVGVGGDVVESRISVDGNAVRTLANGNVADGNLFSVSGTTIIAGDMDGGLEGPIGTARTEWDGSISVSAPFAVQNAQVNEASVSSTVTNAVNVIDVDGTMAGSRIEAIDNSSSSSAAGNRAVNSLAIEGSLVATAADLNSFQVSTGAITARIGQTEAPAGAILHAGGDVLEAFLTVTGNHLVGEAAANSATSSLTVDGNILVNNSGHTDAVAGPLEFGMGASADYALANGQLIEGGYPQSEIEGEGQGFLPIVSTVRGSFAAETGGHTVGSSLEVTGNSQSSSSLGNAANNSLAVVANALGDENSGAPGSALWSNQLAYADMRAISDMALGLAPDAVESSLHLSGNRNVAEARMNDVSNSLSVKGVSAGTLSGLPAGSPGGYSGIAKAVGDHVLASNQVANGSVRASALTDAGHIDPGAELIASSYGAMANETLAYATANNAHNSVSLDVASNREASAALSNSQLSVAGVSAAATAHLGYGGNSVADSQALIGDNSTSAYAGGNNANNGLVVAGTSSATQPPIAQITTGALNAVSAPAVLTNVQVNAGSVSATSYSPTHALSYGGAGVSNSSLALNGNSVAATAYGNNAANTALVGALGQVPATALTNAQANIGPVRAHVAGATYAVAPGSLSAGRLTVNGNAVTASAVGNAATNIISTVH